MEQRTHIILNDLAEAVSKAESEQGKNFLVNFTKFLETKMKFNGQNANEILNLIKEKEKEKEKESGLTEEREYHFREFLELFLSRFKEYFEIDKEHDDKK